jgi:hypothetical protein
MAFLWVSAPRGGWIIRCFGGTHWIRLRDDWIWFTRFRWNQISHPEFGEWIYFRSVSTLKRYSMWETVSRQEPWNPQRKYFYSKTNEMHQFLKFILFCSGTLHVSNGLSVHHQESKTVHTASGICHPGSMAACWGYSKKAMEQWLDMCIFM